MYNKIKKLTKYFKAFGFINTLKYSILSFLNFKRLVKFELNNFNIFLRTQSTDLKASYQNLFDEFDELKNFIDKSFDGLVVDAGGYIGISSIKINLLFPKSKIIVLEPNSENFEVLKQNVEQFLNIKPFNVALSGKHSKEIILNDRGTGEWGFSTAELNDTNLKKNSSVKCLNLERILLDNANNKIDLLKLDINGAEKEIFELNYDILKDIDLIYVELHERIMPGSFQVFKDFNDKENRNLLEVKKNRTFISSKV